MECLARQCDIRGTWHTFIYPIIRSLILVVVSSTIRAMREYQRAVVVTLGRALGGTRRACP
jgi:hypothetical protein